MGMCMHRDYNAMVDAAELSPHVLSTGGENAILPLKIVYNI